MRCREKRSAAVFCCKILNLNKTILKKKKKKKQLVVSVIVFLCSTITLSISLVLSLTFCLFVFLSVYLSIFFSPRPKSIFLVPLPTSWPLGSIAQHQTFFYLHALPFLSSFTSGRRTKKKKKKKKEATHKNHNSDVSCKLNLI